MQLELFKHKKTQCGECGDLVHQDEAIVKTYHTGRSTEQEVFCSDNCACEWYIRHLNCSEK